MANHAKPIPQAEPPEILWGSIVESKDGHHVATMTTKGDRITGRTLSPPQSRIEAEDRYRIWVADELFSGGE
jgi:hypothetical protein